MKGDLREVLPFPVPNKNDNCTSNDNDNDNSTDNSNSNGNSNGNGNGNGTDNNSGHMALPQDSNGFHTYTNQQLAKSATEKLLMYCAAYSLAVLSALMSPSNTRILRM